MKTLRIALIQINSLVGDLAGNAQKILYFLDKTRELGANIVVFPELAICGYPPEDLLLKSYFIKDNAAYLEKIKNQCEDITAIIGFPNSQDGALYNSAAIINNKKVIYTYHKMHLPNYGVFDEKRYFTPGTECAVIRDNHVAWSVNICEDIWVNNGPTMYEAQHGNAQLIINISASPYHRGKLHERENIIRQQAKEFKTAIAYCNLVGGQDELVFDGGSLIVSDTGRVMARGKQFEEDILITDIKLKSKSIISCADPHVKFVDLQSELQPPKFLLPLRRLTPMQDKEEIYSALVLGTRDYVRKNDFKKVILGMSGGIDSALTALIAVDALGKENVVALSMPSEFSSEGTKRDAETVAKNLGIEFHTININDIFSSYSKTLKPYFKSLKWNIAEENIQARIRGNLLMAFSNKFGYMVLTTGNKSETSVGYCTLYGDMAGGFAVLKDVPKELVYELSAYRNKKEKKDLIPKSIFTRPPTAELRHNQKDEDSLPPYPILDPIIESYVEQDTSLKEIVKSGVPKDMAIRVLNLIDRNEYKRRQAPPGVKITPRAFGKDRRMPITCKIA